MSLTDKQERFVQEYLVDLNATQAAIRAGYSEKTADKIGSQLLAKTRVSAKIAEEKAKRNKRTKVDQDYVIQKLKEIADMSASDMIGSRLSYTNKIRAIELLGKHVGAFEKQTNDNGEKVTVIIDV